MIIERRVPQKGKRVLMLTPDIMIDRRILIEAETLIDYGYEVYLLAGWDNNQHDLFETNGRVRIERIKYEGLDYRLKPIYKIQAIIIGCINNCLNSINSFWGKLSNSNYNFINNNINKKTNMLNKISLNGQKKMELLASKYLGNKFIYKFVNKLLYIFVKLIACVSKVSSQLCLIILNITQKLIRFFSKISVSIFIFSAHIVNFIIRLIVKFLPLITGMTAYEYSYYKHSIFYQPDIIHVHDLPMLRIGVRLKKRLRIPLIYDMHEFYSEQDVLTKKQRNKLRRTERKNIFQCDAHITVNPLLAQEISHTYKNIEINVIQNAAVIPTDFHNKRYDLFREEYGISKEEIILLYQGWISPFRNLQNLVTALCKVSEPLKLIIMGYGDYKNELENIAKKTNVIDKIIFVPSKNQEELLYYTASADLGIIPYPKKLDPNTMYASPNKLYEFIAARLPILCNTLPFVSSVVVDNGYGLAVDMDTPESFADALNNFPYKKLNEFKNNLQMTGANYLWDSENYKLLNIYNKLFV